MESDLLDWVLVQGRVDWGALRPGPQTEGAPSGEDLCSEANSLLRQGFIACDGRGRLIPGPDLDDLTDHPLARFWRVLRACSQHARPRHVGVRGVLDPARARRVVTATRQGTPEATSVRRLGHRLTWWGERPVDCARHRLVIDVRFLSGDLPATDAEHPDVLIRSQPRVPIEVEVATNAGWFFSPGASDERVLWDIEDGDVLDDASAWARRCFELASPICEREAATKAREARVLHLLAEGVTDDVAARRLGVSDRQLRRYVAALEQRTGATSRFQLGLLAERQGVLSDEVGDIVSGSGHRAVQPRYAVNERPSVTGSP